MREFDLRHLRIVGMWFVGVSCLIGIGYFVATLLFYEFPSSGWMGMLGTFFGIIAVFLTLIVICCVVTGVVLLCDYLFPKVKDIDKK